MTTRNDVERLSGASARIVTLARRDLAAAFGSLNLANPEAVRDALLEIVPALVREYGDVAATVSAEWYEEVRAGQVGGSYFAQTADTFPDGQMAATVRREAGHLWSDNQAKALAALSGSLQRFVLYSSRETVARNVQRDPARPRYGRVPRGARTCAFCSLLASRGFVYHSERTAGQFDDWHDDCRCAVVMEWDAEGHHIEGYDPDALYDKYMAARDATGSGDPNTILAAMRRMYPNDFTDGVVAPSM